MSKKKTKKQPNDLEVKVDLSNLMDAAKSSFESFDAETIAEEGSVEVSQNILNQEENRAFAMNTESLSNDSLEQFTESYSNSESESNFENETEIESESLSEVSTDTTSMEFESSEGSLIDAKIDSPKETEESTLDSVDFEESKNQSAQEVFELGAETGDIFESEEIENIQAAMEIFSEDDFLAMKLDEPSEENLKVPELEGSELEGFESASIEELEFIEDSRLLSIIESVLFATDRPVSLPTLKQIFKGTNVTNARLKRALDSLQIEFAGVQRGITIEEVGSGYQLRTKLDNMEFMRKSFKSKGFKLSGPALEVLAITAYKQPVVKAEIDEIRGVESGHLLRALMEKNLVLFDGKSDLPGKPMQYATSRKFLEIFGLRNLKELPSLSQIDELLPDGIGDEEQKPVLADITESLSEKVGDKYSESEEELNKITDQLVKIETSSEFFEKEKVRQKEARDAEKAQNLREALTVGEVLSNRDLNWLKRYDEQIALAQNGGVIEPNESSSELVNDGVEVNSTILGANDEFNDLEAALQAWDQEENAEEGDSEIFERIEDNDLADIDEEIP